MESYTDYIPFIFFSNVCHLFIQNFRCASLTILINVVVNAPIVSVVLRRMEDVETVVMLHAATLPIITNIIVSRNSTHYLYLN